MRLPIILLLLFAQTNFAWAADFTRSNGALSNQNFYRAVACKASPGGACREAFIRWPKSVQSRLTIGIVKQQTGSAAYGTAAQAALKNAVDQINNAGARVELRVVSGSRAKAANIRIYLTEPKGITNKISGTGDRLLDGRNARNAIAASAVVGRFIISAAISVAVPRVKQENLRGIILEETVQTLGLPWDIHNPYYDTRSIFAQVGRDDVDVLTGQDKAALLMHYPK